MDQSNITRMMARVTVLIPHELVDWMKKSQFMDDKGQLALLEVLEYRLMMERRRNRNILCGIAGLMIIFILVLKFLVK